jgi:hypothetical protein
MNEVAKLEMGRHNNSRRGRVLCLAMKYWLSMLQMGEDELVRERYEWQIV